MQIRLKKLHLLSNYYLLLIIVVTIICLFLPIPWTVTAQGVIEPEVRHFVKPDVGGIISNVLVESGEKVTEGQPIVRLSDPNIAIYSASNKAEYEKAKMQLEYTKKMYSKGYISMNELKKAEIDYDVELTKIKGVKNFDVVAPASGTFLTTDEFNLRVGDKIDPGSIIATIADLNKMRMKVRVPDHNISKVQKGNDVHIYLNAFPVMLYKALSGHVNVIYPQAQIDNTGSNFIVIISLDKNNLIYGSCNIKLFPGMVGYAKVTYEKSSFFKHAIIKSFDTFK